MASKIEQRLKRKNRIRKKLDKEGKPSLIQTVRGRGYALRAT